MSGTHQKLIGLIREKLNGIDNNQEVQEDTEFDRITNFAQQHYPGSKNKQEAFMKYVQRALKHSEEDDRNQDQELVLIRKEIESLKNKIASSVSENHDFLDEK